MTTVVSIIAGVVVFGIVAYVGLYVFAIKKTTSFIKDIVDIDEDK